ncbi:hypothetical protein ABH15_12280 [Methanoculleus taiwanensis]|uniref:polynucleotide 5'-hydroxyl-kinase n=1 Tax=Methanoculleus taiwanensis TaxID=1550565 RepID=A0A498GY44_9EURY|nr:Clp1/GlmU family protein [Methanoculleus taiwanensis]RXE55492.1 hypothetical protein ABH15_12280 [Methanoculleus taiwanensis]
MSEHQIQREDTWDAIADALRAGEELQSVYVLGGTDSGKSTLCRYLIDETKDQRICAYLDCDTGQSVVGVPTTLGLRMYHPHTAESGTRLRFVGSTSPRGHLLQTVTGAKRLFEAAIAADASAIVIDSPGYIHGDAAFEFQFQMIDLLQPSGIAVLGYGREFDRLCAHFRHHPGMTIHRLRISPAVVRRSAAERRKYREQKFRKYFQDAEPREIAYSGLGLQGRVPDLYDARQVRHRLIAVCDAGNFVLTLGILKTIDTERKEARFISPPTDLIRAASIRFGSIFLDPRAAAGEMESHTPFPLPGNDRKEHPV